MSHLTMLRRATEGKTSVALREAWWSSDTRGGLGSTPPAPLCTCWVSQALLCDTAKPALTVFHRQESKRCVKSFTKQKAHPLQGELSHSDWPSSADV